MGEQFLFFFFPLPWSFQDVLLLRRWCVEIGDGEVSSHFFSFLPPIPFYPARFLFPPFLPLQSSKLPLPFGRRDGRIGEFSVFPLFSPQ